jgi:hypothetical protein
MIQIIHVSLSKQIFNLQVLNKQKAWGFTDKDFDRATVNAPKREARSHEAWTLVPYWETPKLTYFRLLTHVLLQQSKCHALRTPPPVYEQAKVRLVNEHPGKMLRWELISVGREGEYPRDYRRFPKHKLPHAGVLAAIAFGTYVMNDHRWDLSIPGYQVPNNLNRTVGEQMGELYEEGFGFYGGNTHTPEIRYNRGFEYLTTESDYCCPWHNKSVFVPMIEAIA